MTFSPQVQAHEALCKYTGKRPVKFEILLVQRYYLLCLLQWNAMLEVPPTTALHHTYWHIHLEEPCDLGFFLVDRYYILVEIIPQEETA